MAVLFYVQLGSVLMVLYRMQVMAVGEVGVVSSLFMVAGSMMLCRLFVVPRRMLVMLGGFFMVFVNCHGNTPLRGETALRL